MKILYHRNINRFFKNSTQGKQLDVTKMLEERYVKMKVFNYNFSHVFVTNY